MFMRISSSVVNLDGVITIECYQGVEYPEIMIEYPHSVKRFTIPIEMDPEKIAAIIHHKIATEPKGFSLLECLAEYMDIYG